MELTARDKENPRESNLFDLMCVITIGLMVAIPVALSPRNSNREKDLTGFFTNPTNRYELFVTSRNGFYHCFDKNRDGQTLERAIVYENNGKFTITREENLRLFESLDASYKQIRRD